MEATGHACVLARPERGERACSGKPGAYWACTFLARACLSMANGGHGDDQGCQEVLLDMMKVRGGIRDGRGHEERHGHDMVMIRSLCGF
jgi:hypothetical protein